jgi:hypothetical protein
LFPRFDVAICSLEWKEALWDKSFTAAPRPRTQSATIRQSQATTVALSRELGINVKTVAMWRKRETLKDRKTGPTEPSSTVLSSSEEAMIVAFWRHTLLPLDDWQVLHSRYF